MRYQQGAWNRNAVVGYPSIPRQEAGTLSKPWASFCPGRGAKDYRPGPAAKAGVPFSLWKGPSVSSQDEERFKAYGAQFVA